MYLFLTKDYLIFSGSLLNFFTQGNLQISMYVEDYDSYYSSVYIDRIVMKVSAIKRVTYSSELTFTGERLSNPTTATIKYRFICNSNYYGPYCTVYCLAQNNMTVSYNCDPLMDKICSAGFGGPSCFIGEFTLIIWHDNGTPLIYMIRLLVASSQLETPHIQPRSDCCVVVVGTSCILNST